MVKNPPANTGDMDAIPDLGRSHMPQSNSAPAPQLLNLCPRAQELQLLKPGYPRARALQPESSPGSQLEKSLHTVTKTQHHQKFKKKLFRTGFLTWFRDIILSFKRSVSWMKKNSKVYFQVPH